MDKQDVLFLAIALSLCLGFIAGAVSMYEIEVKRAVVINHPMDTIAIAGKKVYSNSGMNFKFKDRGTATDFIDDYTQSMNLAVQDSMSIKEHRQNTMNLYPQFFKKSTPYD